MCVHAGVPACVCLFPFPLPDTFGLCDLVTSDSSGYSGKLLEKRSKVITALKGITFLSPLFIEGYKRKQ